MNLVLYDGSYEGLLTAVFEIYEYAIETPSIREQGEATGSLFGRVHTVQTNRDKSSRVFKKLQEKLSGNALRQLYTTFLSELDDIENVLYRYIKYCLSNDHAVENDFSDPDILLVQQVSRKVHREKHRMEAFVRFQLTKDELYYAIIQPDYNVLPLVRKHFEDRYADQRWLVYDSMRRYGLYYDGNQVEEVEIKFKPDLNNNKDLKGVYDEEEILYQQLWQQYFQSVNIAARRNMKLHIQHMPRRYWKYLVEKNAKPS